MLKRFPMYIKLKNKKQETNESVILRIYRIQKKNTNTIKQK